MAYSESKVGEKRHQVFFKMPFRMQFDVITPEAG